MTNVDGAAGFLTFLPERKTILVAGADATKFLGDLVSGDVAGATPERASYAALLTPQGKVLFDFLVFRRDDGFVLDVPAGAAADLAKRLSFYKLRAAVEVRETDDRIVAAWGAGDPGLAGVVADPRLPALGFRGAVAAGATGDVAGFAPSTPEAYHAHRIALAVPEAPHDFAYGDVFPHDIAMDQLGGVDFRKGCYVGQEVVSRMQHRGTARRRIVSVTTGAGAGTGAGADLPPPGAAIEADGRPLGALGSVAGPAGIAIVRLDRAADAMAGGATITAAGIPVTLALPGWAAYGWPETGTPDDGGSA